MRKIKKNFADKISSVALFTVYAVLSLYTFCFFFFVLSSLAYLFLLNHKRALRTNEITTKWSWAFCQLDEFVDKLRLTMNFGTFFYIYLFILFSASLKIIWSHVSIPPILPCRRGKTHSKSLRKIRLKISFTSHFVTKIKRESESRINKKVLWRI